LNKINFLIKTFVELNNRIIINKCTPQTWASIDVNDSAKSKHERKRETAERNCWHCWLLPEMPDTIFAF